MKIHSLIIIALMAIACNEAVLYNDNTNIIRFKADIENGATKMGLNQDYSVQWSAGDAISVFTASGTNLKFSTETSGTSVEFTGLGQSSDTYSYALYPYNADAIISGALISSRIPAIQSAAANTFGGNMNMAVAVNNDMDLYFTNAIGLMKFNIAEGADNIENITLSGNNNEKIAGDVTIDMSVDLPIAEVTSDGDTKITLQSESGFQNGVTYYFVVPVMEFTKGISLLFEFKDNTFGVLNGNSPAEIKRSGILDLGTLTPVAKSGNPAVFIDPVFASQMLEKNYIQDIGNLTFNELSAIKKIELSASANAKGPLTSIKGVEFMPSLQVLKCEYHNISSADMSHNTELVELYMTGNVLETVDLTNTAKLVRCYLAINKISEIELIGKPVLRLLYLGENNLAELDLTGCSPSALIGFTCAGNPGRNGEFRVKAWFDNSSIPANFTNSNWKDDTGNPVILTYYTE